MNSSVVVDDFGRADGPPEQTGGVRAKLSAAIRSRMVWTLADQGVVSIGNFLFGVILARHLAKTAYGEFALILETLLFLNTLQYALVMYPMSVRGATHDSHALRRFASASLWMTLGLVPVLGLALCAAVYYGMGSHESNSATSVLVVAAIAAMLLWQMQEGLRRALMAELRFMAALPGDAVSYIGQVLMLAWMAHTHTLSIAGAFFSIGVSSGAAILIQAVQIGLVRLRFSELRDIARDFWTLGHWTLLANLAGVITTVGYTWTLRIFRGLDATAAYAAMIVPLKLANPLIIGTGNLLVPAVARTAKSLGRRATISVALRYGGIGAAMIFAYYGFVAICPHFVLALIFRADSPYLHEAAPLRLYLLNAAVCYVETVLLAWLLGLGEVRANGLTQIFHALLTVTIALPATAVYGIYGLIAGNLLAVSLCAIMQLFMLRNALGIVIGSGSGNDSDRDDSLGLQARSAA